MKTKTTHGSRELDEDAAKLEAMGADSGPSFCPYCGYTQLDKQFWGDHYLCKGGKGKSNVRRT